MCPLSVLCFLFVGVLLLCVCVRVRVCVYLLSWPIGGITASKGNKWFVCRSQETCK